MIDRKQEVLDIFERYWNRRSDVVLQLPVVRAEFLPEELPPKLDWCELPRLGLRMWCGWENSSPKSLGRKVGSGAVV